MKPKAPTQHRQRRERELAMFMPSKATPGDPDSWVDDLTDDELADLLGPSWAAMTERQRRLYPVLPAEEMDRLWGMSQGDHLDAA